MPLFGCNHDWKILCRTLQKNVPPESLLTLLRKASTGEITNFTIKNLNVLSEDRTELLLACQECGELRTKVLRGMAEDDDEDKEETTD